MYLSTRFLIRCKKDKNCNVLKNLSTTIDTNRNSNTLLHHHHHYLNLKGANKEMKHRREDIRDKTKKKRKDTTIKRIKVNVLREE